MRNFLSLTLLVFVAAGIACDDRGAEAESTDAERDADVTAPSNDLQDGVSLDVADIGDRDVSGDTTSTDGGPDVTQNEDSHRFDANDQDSIPFNDDLDTMPSQDGVDTLAYYCWEPQLEPVDEFFVRPDFAPGYNRFVLESAQEFVDVLGVPPPASIAFPEEAAVLYSATAWYGGTTEVASLRVCTDQYHATEVPRRPGIDCERLLPDQAGLHWSAFRLFKAPAPLVAGLNPQSGGSSGSDTEYSCAAEGAGLAQICSHHALCQPGLICAGLTRAPTGVCVPAGNRVMLTNSVATPIPDGDAAGVEIVNQVAGASGVDADVIVLLVIDHASLADLALSVVSPTGREAVIDNLGTGDWVIPQRFVGEPVNGTWTLRVADTAIGNQGEVDRWTLAIVTRPQ